MQKLKILALSLLFAACQNQQSPSTVEESGSTSDMQLEEGPWRATIMLNDTTAMPFDFQLEQRDDSTFRMTILNAEEKIEAMIEPAGDSLRISLPVFANYMMVQTNGQSMEGYFINPDAEDYQLPFSARAGQQSRFKLDSSNCCDINKKWRVAIGADTTDLTPAIAYFEQDSTYVSGTFMTETGDYRYLEGNLHGNNLQLSAFDGAHLFYFEAEIEDGQKINGRFYSGRSYLEPWKAWRDQDFELADPDTLTYLREGYESLSFSFPNLEGDSVSLNDARFEGKPVIVQILGSWCPNCMDESRYLRDIYKRYHEEGLEVIGISFERTRGRETAEKRVAKMIEDIGIPYPVLMGGYTRDDKAAEKLPMLNHVMSYPTAIYLNDRHEVVKIHTGFSGPGTPVYEQYIATNKSLIEDLLDAKD